MLASLLSTVVSLGISFFITPPIIARLGAQAQGFNTMAANFVNYAAIAAMALNSMAGRFITVHIAQGDEAGANRYFNSVMYANLVIVAALLLPAALLYITRQAHYTKPYFASPVTTVSSRIRSASLAI